MKKLFYILLLSVCFSAKAQVNLVPNGSFEDTIPCTTSSISPNLAAIGWYSVYGSPDYFNPIYLASCGYNCDYAPYSGWGYQTALEGNGYIGFSTYCNPGICGPNNREWAQIQLSSTLITNKKYLASFFVNLAANCDYATDDIGAAITVSSIVPLGYSNQINNSSGNYITDTVNWTLITGIMTATGGEQYITIGNFKNDANTSIIPNNPPSWAAGTYYFTDMVSVYELPDIEAGISDTICVGDTVNINASCTGAWAGLQYRWFPSIGLSDTTILNPIAQPAVTTTYYFGLIDTSGTLPGIANYLDSITIMVGCAGIEELGKDTYGKMFPNPANTFAYYELELGSNEKGTLEFYDLLGKKITEQKLNAGSKKTVIDLSEMTNGIYVYKVIINDQYKACNKIIITK